MAYRDPKNQTMDQNCPTVIVTGFGPFGSHKVNASWEAVKMLSSMDIEGEFGIRLVTIELPVDYKFIDQRIPQLWAQYKPMLVIHVGVSSIATDITLEMEAKNFGYCLLDIEGYVPANGVCCTNQGGDCIKSSLNIPEIGVKVSEEEGVPKCDISSNAGRYLCEYTYYTSLNMDRSRSIFIHVPELGKPYTALQLAQGIKSVLRESLKVLHNPATLIKMGNPS